MLETSLRTFPPGSLALTRPSMCLIVTVSGDVRGIIRGRVQGSALTTGQTFVPPLSCFKPVAGRGADSPPSGVVSAPRAREGRRSAREGGGRSHPETVGARWPPGNRARGCRRPSPCPFGSNCRCFQQPQSKATTDER